MVNQFLADKIRDEFGLLPTPQQDTAIDQLASFLCATDQNAVFLLKGCAGTGKTSLVSALIRTLAGFQQDVVLLAPTGRAAKVLSSYAGRPAFTPVYLPAEGGGGVRRGVRP